MTVLTLDYLKKNYFSDPHNYLKQRISQKTGVLARPTPYFGAWQVTRILLSLPFDLCIYIILKISEAFFKLIRCSQNAKGCKLYASHCFRDFDELRLQWNYKNKLIVPTINLPSTAAKNLAIRKLAGLKKIDPALKPYTIYAQPHPLHILRNGMKGNQSIMKTNFWQDGSCRGMSAWMLYLLLTTFDPNQDPRAQLKIVGEKFARGAPAQALILQAFIGLEKMLLKMRLKPVLELARTETIMNKQYVIEQMNQLPCGYYNLGTLEHCIVYIKQPRLDGTIFHAIWDPEIGGLELDQGREAHELYTYLVKPGMANDLGFIAFAKASLQS